MKVLIVGAGIGGLTLASFFKKFGIDFDVVEKLPNWERHGYSIGIWDNGRDILKKLGLEEKFDREGERIKDFIICNGRGRVLKRYNLANFYTNYGSAYTHLNRGLLHDWLRGLVGEEKIKLGATIKSLEEDKLRVYDAVVGADGVHSQIRKLAFHDEDYEHYSEWRVWLVWISNKYKKEKTVIQYIEPRQFISIFDDKDQALCVLVAPVGHTEWDNREDRIQRIKKLFNRHELVGEIFGNISAQEITPTNLSFVEMKKWVSGRAVLLGDAAHAMEPFGGLGASMAMEDAYVLAGEMLLVKEQKKTLKEALSSYEEKRKTRVKTAKQATKNMRWWAICKPVWLQKTIMTLMPFVPAKFFTEDFHKLLKQEI